MDITPDELLDLTVDWTSWLGQDTIASSAWQSDGITLTNAASDQTSATVWVDGSTGTVGSKYTVRNVVTTAAGRTGARSVVVSVVKDKFV